MSHAHLPTSIEKDASHPYLYGLLVFMVLAVTAICAYWSILNNTLLGDDFSEINRLFQMPASELWRLFEVNAPAFVRPIPYFLFWFQYRFFGLEGLPSHLINVGLHTGSAFFLYWFLSRNSLSRLVSFMAALLFLLLTLAPEAVTCSAGRVDPTALLLTLLPSRLSRLADPQSSGPASSATLMQAPGALRPTG